MQKIVILALIALVVSKTIWIAQSRGNDQGTGSFQSPFLTLTKALTVIEDGDLIKAEIGVYQHSTKISKSISIEGVREHAKWPLFSGEFDVSNTESFSISNCEAEHPSGRIFRLNKVNKVTIANMNLGPTSSILPPIVVTAAKLFEFRDSVISKCTHGPTFGGTGSDAIEAAEIKNVKFIGIRSSAISFTNMKRLSIENVDDSEHCVGISAQCGLLISSVENFAIRGTKVINSEVGFYIQGSTGTIDNSEVSGANRVYSAYGGGMYLSNSQVRTRGLRLVNNKAQNGAGFFCSGGSLNMFEGRVEGNVATANGGAGQCSAGCSYFVDGTQFVNNTQTRPSDCRGIPQK